MSTSDGPAEGDDGKELERALLALNNDVMDGPHPPPVLRILADVLATKLEKEWGVSPGPSYRESMLTVAASAVAAIQAEDARTPVIVRSGPGAKGGPAWAALRLVGLWDSGGRDAVVRALGTLPPLRAAALSAGIAATLVGRGNVEYLDYIRRLGEGD